jgi:hypothetical protein
MIDLDPIIAPDIAATNWLGGVPVFFAPGGAPAVRRAIRGAIAVSHSASVAILAIQLRLVPDTLAA